MSFFSTGKARNDGASSSTGSNGEFLRDGADHEPRHEGYIGGVLGSQGQDNQAPLSVTDRAASEAHPHLPIEDVGRINRQAQMRGTVNGILVGLLSTFASRNFIKLSPKASTMTGLSLGVIVGYASTWSNVTAGLRELETARIGRQTAAKAQPNIARSTSALNRGASDDSLMEKLDLRAGQQTEFEGGVAGMHAYRDRSHSTRGDH